MACRTAAAMPAARGVLLARRAHHRTRKVDQALERKRPALQMDQDTRSDHRPHLPLLLTHLRIGTLEIFNAGSYRAGGDRSVVLCRGHEVSRWRWADRGRAG